MVFRPGARHTGECTIDNGSASGPIEGRDELPFAAVQRAPTKPLTPPVDLAAGIACHASAGEALVSRTVRDIVGDAGLPFEDRGLHQIPGMGEWRLYKV